MLRSPHLDPLELFPQSARQLISIRAQELIATLGYPVLRQIVTDVLTGLNVRTATEKLTKRRINLLNGAILAMFVKLHDGGMSYVDIQRSAREHLRAGRLSKEDKSILLWILGLTQKQVDNVLRSDDNAWTDYMTALDLGIKEGARESEGMHGTMPLHLRNTTLSWEWALSLLMAVGSQTLAIRGSEKSLYGKFFEKLVLVSALSTLGFTLTTRDAIGEGTFWLSSRGDKRESDATAIWRLGQGVRFDIGFIGKGNPEITLDKVTRFERITEIAGSNYFMHTFIIVDTVARGSSIFDLATDIEGTIIQMSANNWVQTLGERLSGVFEHYHSPLAGMNHRQYRVAVSEGVQDAPLERVI